MTEDNILSHYGAKGIKKEDLYIYRTLELKDYRIFKNLMMNTKLSETQTNKYRRLQTMT